MFRVFIYEVLCNRQVSPCPPARSADYCHKGYTTFGRLDLHAAILLLACTPPMLCPNFKGIAGIP